MLGDWTVRLYPQVLHTQRPSPLRLMTTRLRPFGITLPPTSVGSSSGLQTRTGSSPTTGASDAGWRPPQNAPSATSTKRLHICFFTASPFGPCGTLFSQFTLTEDLASAFRICLFIGLTTGCMPRLSSRFFGTSGKEGMLWSLTTLWKSRMLWPKDAPPISPYGPSAVHPQLRNQF